MPSKVFSFIYVYTIKYIALALYVNTLYIVFLYTFIHFNSVWGCGLFDSYKVDHKDQAGVSRNGRAWRLRTIS